MSISPISQFCQRIPFCEEAKTFLTENSKIVLLTAIGLIGITLIARRILYQSQSPNGSARQERSLTDSRIVVIPSDDSSDANPQLSSALEATVPLLPEAAADDDDDDDDAAASVVIHRDQTNPPLPIQAAAQPAAPRRPPPTLLRTLSQMVIEIAADVSRRSGMLLSSDYFDVSHNNSTWDVHCFRNSHTCRIVMDGVTFFSATVAILALQFPQHQMEFATLSIAQAKSLISSNNWEMSEDWRKNRGRIAHDVLKAKFNQNPILKRNLLLTSKSYLVYAPSEKDPFRYEEDTNQFGIALMEIRGELGGTGVVERPKGEPAPVEEQQPKQNHSKKRSTLARVRSAFKRGPPRK